MKEKLGAFFGAIGDGSLDFARLGEFFKSCFDAFFMNEHLVKIWTAIKAFFGGLGVALPILLFAITLIIMLLGKKLISVERFIAFTVLGYIVGVLGVSPLINKIFALPEVVSGIILALVAAVLSKYLYHTAVALAAGYSVFLVFYTDSVFATIGTQGNLTVCIIFGAVAAALVIIFSKITAMALTSALGAYLTTRVVTVFIKNYEAPDVMGGKGWILTLCITLVLGVVGFIVQYKTRTRY